MRQGIFITGTDTGIGKTLVSTLLMSALAKTRQNPGYFKPIQTGNDLDTETVVHSLKVDAEFKILPPRYSFPEPLAPSRAAAKQGKHIDLAQIEGAWREMDDRPWVIEGAGGVLVPLNSRETIRDLISCLQVPVLLVASTRLGTINHTLLSLEALDVIEEIIE